MIGILEDNCVQWKPPEAHTVTKMCSKTSGETCVHWNQSDMFCFCDSVFSHCCSFMFVSRQLDCRYTGGGNTKIWSEPNSPWCVTARTSHRVNGSMHLLMWERQYLLSPGQRPCVSPCSRTTLRQSSHAAGRQRPYPAEIRQIKAALKVYGPD